MSAEGKRAKFYTLLPAGRKQFLAERERWRIFTAVVEEILRAT